MSGSLEVVSTVFSGRIVQDTKSDSDVSALSSLSVLVHKVGLFKVLSPVATLPPVLPLLSPVSPLSALSLGPMLAKSSSASSVIAAMKASVSLPSGVGGALKALVKLRKVEAELPSLSVTRGQLSEVVIIIVEVPGQDGGGEGHHGEDEMHDEVQG